MYRFLKIHGLLRKLDENNNMEPQHRDKEVRTALFLQFSFMYKLNIICNLRQNVSFYYFPLCNYLHIS